MNKRQQTAIANLARTLRAKNMGCDHGAISPEVKAAIELLNANGYHAVSELYMDTWILPVLDNVTGKPEQQDRALGLSQTGAPEPVKHTPAKAESATPTKATTFNANGDRLTVEVCRRWQPHQDGKFYFTVYRGTTCVARSDARWTSQGNALAAGVKWAKEDSVGRTLPVTRQLQG